MRLLVTTPTAVVTDLQDVRHVRAEDETGAFGILAGHADFLTVLAISVVSWRSADGSEGHVAVRGGVLTVRGGEVVEIAAREAVGEDTLGRLDEAVLERFRAEASAEAASRTAETRMHLAAIHGLRRYLDSGRQTPPRPPGSLRPGALGGEGEAGVGHGGGP